MGLAPRIVAVLCVGWLGMLPAAYAADPTGGIVGEIQAKPAKYREHVVVHLERVAGSFRPPPQPVVYDQKGMRFTPHVMPILRGTQVRFLNSDTVRHNVFTPDGDAYNLGTWGQGESQTKMFARSGVYRQLCNIHPEMEGFIVVLDNPHFTVTGEDGKFRLEGVPPGTYTLRAWSEKLPAVTQSVTVTAGATTTAKLELRKP